MAQGLATNALASLQQHMAELDDLYASMGLLSWDLETMMPPKGAESRSRQMATLSALAHRMACSPQLGDWLSELEDKAVQAALSETHRAIVREVRRAYDEAVKLPESLVTALSETTSAAHLKWVEARKSNSFEVFLPSLKQIVKLNQEKADALGYENSRYNALLDIYEPGLTVATLDPLFADLEDKLKPLVAAIAQKPKPDISFKQRTCTKEQQKALCQRLLEAIGFDFEAGRLDDAPHPFCSGSNPGDVRLTNRYLVNDWTSAIFSALHEGGHGLYEQGINSQFAGTVLGGGVSLGIHESQSRLWENLIGRSQSFVTFLMPLFQEQLPEAITGIDAKAFYRAINIVEPSFIRVEADEVTYNLHIVLRYQLEKALIEGSLAVEDLPEAWGAGMNKLLGIRPATDSESCLQDIHWAHGSFGYFATYTLGNLYSAQFLKTARNTLPDLDTQIQQGELQPLRQWLQEHIHQYGRLYEPDTLCQRVTGEPLNAQYFINYLQEKYTALYAL